NPGANLFTPMTLALTDVQYFNSDIAEIEAKTGTYPSGTYRICLWTECAQPDCNGAGQNAGSIEMPVCIQVNVENPTPLVLAFPTDKSEIDETRPTYTWIPPAPIAGIGGLNYTMTLVEMMDGQSKSDALAMNRPIIDMQGINASTMMHPTDFPELEAGKTYAWQVQAYVGNTFVAKSEQWQFKVKKDTAKKVGKTILTFKTDYNVNPYYVKQSDSLLLVFEQSYQYGKKADWKIKLTDEYSNKDISIDLNVLSDFFSGRDGIMLSPLHGYKIEMNKVYRMELRNLKGEVFYIRIIFNS
ncbi:MAG TPA: hypothetical protein VGF79_06045, partial [Bacteroidia bacterium]